MPLVQARSYHFRDSKVLLIMTKAEFTPERNAARENIGRCAASCVVLYVLIKRMLNVSKKMADNNYTQITLFSYVPVMGEC